MSLILHFNDRKDVLMRFGPNYAASVYPELGWVFFWSNYLKVRATNLSVTLDYDFKLDTRIGSVQLLQLVKVKLFISIIFRFYLTLYYNSPRL